MDFKRPAAAVLGRLTLFGAGAGVALTVTHRLYVSAAVLGLAALWAVGVSAWAARPKPPLRPPPTPDLDAVQAERRMLASLIDQTPAPLLTLRADGSVWTANRAARTLFRADGRLPAPPPALVKAMEADPDMVRRTVVLRAGEEERTFAMSVTELSGPHGMARLTALLDIQPELRVAEAAALNELMQVLSHEIMNALTPIASLAATAVDLLVDATPDATIQARDAVATLGRRAEGLGRFVDAYRTLARLPPLTRQVISLTALMEETARLFEGRWAARGIQLELTRPSPDIVASLDEDLIIHALTNLLSNGADAALLCMERAPVVRLSASAHENGMMLRVSDSGPGVALDARERIFQPFFTTKMDGTGVGLSFARQVALSHGGDLKLANSDQGEGAIFEIIL